MLDSLVNFFSGLLQQPLASPFGATVTALALFGLIIAVAILIGLAVIGLSVLRCVVKNRLSTNQTADRTDRCRSLQPIAAALAASACSDTPETLKTQMRAISDFQNVGAEVSPGTELYFFDSLAFACTALETAKAHQFDDGKVGEGVRCRYAAGNVFWVPLEAVRVLYLVKR